MPPVVLFLARALLSSLPPYILLPAKNIPYSRKIHEMHPVPVKTDLIIYQCVTRNDKVVSLTSYLEACSVMLLPLT